MKTTSVLLGVCVLLATSGARASWFEFCDLEGDIQGIKEPSKGSYQLDVHVTKVSRASEHGDIGYTDCQEHNDKVLDVAFKASELPRKPAVGDRISLSRSVVDGFSNNGAYVGTSINTRLHKLRAGGR